MSVAGGVQINGDLARLARVAETFTGAKPNSYPYQGQLNLNEAIAEGGVRPPAASARWGPSPIVRDGPAGSKRRARAGAVFRGQRHHPESAGLRFQNVFGSHRQGKSDCLGVEFHRGRRREHFRDDRRHRAAARSGGRQSESTCRLGNDAVPMPRTTPRVFLAPSRTPPRRPKRQALRRRRNLRGRNRTRWPGAAGSRPLLDRANGYG